MDVINLDWTVFPLACQHLLSYTIIDNIGNAIDTIFTQHEDKVTV